MAQKQNQQQGKQPQQAIEKAPEKLTSIKSMLNSEVFQSAIEKILPAHIKPDRMARVAIAALTRTPDLKKCTQESFVNAMMTLSQLGIEPDGRRAHLIPYRNNKRNCYEVQLIIDYKGIVSVIMRTGLLATVPHADVVCENDEFEYNLGQVTKHTIDFKKPRGEMYAAYCIITMKDGTKKCEVMPKEEIDRIRKASRAGSSGPWVDHYNEMAKKTVFRRASKWIPWEADESTHAAIQEAFAADDASFDFGDEGRSKRSSKTIRNMNHFRAGMNQSDDDNIIDGEFTEGDGEQSEQNPEDLWSQLKSTAAELWPNSPDKELETYCTKRGVPINGITEDQVASILDELSCMLDERKAMAEQ